MTSAEYDRAYLEAAQKPLEDYLHAQDLYWVIPDKPPKGERAFPSLTLGNVLLAYTRLKARAPQEAEEVFRPIAALRQRWPAVWANKARREIQSRLQRWADYLREYEEDHGQASYYPYQVRQRVIVELLSQELDALPAAETTMLERLDHIVKTFFHPGPFIWDKDLAPAFPPQPYWYLYGHLKQS